MRHWLRSFTMPWHLLVAVVLYAGTWLIMFMSSATYRSELVVAEKLQHYAFVFGVILCAVALAYGALRAYRPHPLFHSAYFDWLWVSPWVVGQPLPAGPLHPVWQDGVLLSGLTILGYVHIREYWYFIPLAWILAYGLPLCYSFVVFKERRVVYAAAFGFGLLCLLTPYPLLFSLCWAALLGLLCWALHRSLVVLSARQDQDVQDPAAVFSPPQPAMRISGPMVLSPARLSDFVFAPERLIAGWPLGVFSAAPMRTLFSRGERLLLSLLAGWFSLVILVLLKANASKDDFSGFFLAINGVALFGAVALRLVMYFEDAASPTSLWGRLCTGRLVIPGFDKVFLAPVAALLVAPLPSLFFDYVGIPWCYGVPIGLAAAFAITLNMGPSLQHWQLAGVCRSREPVDRGKQSPLKRI